MKFPSISIILMVSRGFKRLVQGHHRRRTSSKSFVDQIMITRRRSSLIYRHHIDQGWNGKVQLRSPGRLQSKRMRKQTAQRAASKTFKAAVRSLIQSMSPEEMAIIDVRALGMPSWTSRSSGIRSCVELTDWEGWLQEGLVIALIIASGKFGSDGDLNNVDFCFLQSRFPTKAWLVGILKDFLGVDTVYLSERPT